MFRAQVDMGTKRLESFARYFSAGWYAGPAEARPFGHSELSSYLSPVVRIEQDSARPLIKMFDVIKCRYFSHTNMEVAETSPFIPDQTTIKPWYVTILQLMHPHQSFPSPPCVFHAALPRSWLRQGCYDPLIGMANVVYVRLLILAPQSLSEKQTTTHFGMLVFGSDINGRQSETDADARHS
jgi:hypothetical protein